MAETIRDGTGAGYLTGVDATNKLSVRAVQESSNLEASQSGDFYFLSSGLIQLTSANASALIFVQNDETRDLQMTRLIFGCGATTGGTTDFCIVAAEIGGTGLSSSNAAAGQTNANFGSNKTLSLTSEIGEEAATVTDGTAGPAFFFQVQRTSTFDAFITIPKGASIAFKVTPPAGNTSILAAVAINAFLIAET